MIVVEGPDGAGKTTLCKLLEADFGLPIAKTENRNSPEFRSPEEVRKRTYSALLKAVSGRHEPEIHDRMFFSELVYGHVMRTGPCFKPPEEKHICRLLAAMEIPIIFCLPEKYELFKQIAGHDHMEGVTENLERLYNAYHAMWLAMRLPPAEIIPGFTSAGNPTNPKTTRIRETPQVIRYDYKQSKTKTKVYRAVQDYLAKRALRSQGWV